MGRFRATGDAAGLHSGESLSLGGDGGLLLSDGAAADELEPDGDGGDGCGGDAETDCAGLAGVLRVGDGRTGAAVDPTTLGTATAATLALTAGLDGIVAPSAGILTVPPGVTCVVAYTVGPTTTAGPAGPDCASAHTTPTAPAVRIRPTPGSQRR
jgi:hypothetical protein